MSNSKIKKAHYSGRPLHSLTIGSITLSLETLLHAASTLLKGTLVGPARTVDNSRSKATKSRRMQIQVAILFYTFILQFHLEFIDFRKPRHT